MSATFNLKTAALKSLKSRDPRLIMRVVLGVLLLANVTAALLLFKPWGASPAELEQELGQLRSQVAAKKASMGRLRTLVEKSRKAREEGDSFMDEYFMDRRTASSTIIAELRDSANEAGIKQKEHSFGYEPIEGSDDLWMMTISGNYEGQYADLVKFMNLLDRSPRFLILDTLTAAPERIVQGLSMNFKMNAFVIDQPRPVVPPPAKADAVEELADAGQAAEDPGAPPGNRGGKPDEDAPPAPEAGRETPKEVQAE